MATSPADEELDARWQGLCTQIQATDDISLKLLGFVPLITVAGIATSLFKAEPKLVPIIALLSLFAAGITLAIWVWERRNIQTCLWLRCRAAELEERAFGPFAGQFAGFPDKPGRQGKTEAERMLYGMTIGAWLLLPAAVAAPQLTTIESTNAQLLIAAYALAAGGLGRRALRELRVKICLTATLPDGKTAASTAP